MKIALFNVEGRATDIMEGKVADHVRSLQQFHHLGKSAKVLNGSQWEAIQNPTLLPDLEELKSLQDFSSTISVQY